MDDVEGRLGRGSDKDGDVDADLGGMAVVVVVVGGTDGSVTVREEKESTSTGRPIRGEAHERCAVRGDAMGIGGREEERTGAL